VSSINRNCEFLPSCPREKNQLNATSDYLAQHVQALDPLKQVLDAWRILHLWSISALPSASASAAAAASTATVPEPSSRERGVAASFVRRCFSCSQHHRVDLFDSESTGPLPSRASSVASSDITSVAASASASAATAGAVIIGLLLVSE